MFDVADVVRRLVRHWRGSHTQMELSVELGWSSNVVSHWEAGRRVPRVSTALAMAEARNGGATRLVALLSDEDWAPRPEAWSVMGVGLLLGDVIAHRSIRRVAASIGRDEATMHRWLTGQQEPSIVDFLELLGHQGRAHLAVSALSDGSVPTGSVGSFKAIVMVVLLFSDAYRNLPRHDDAWLAERVQITPNQASDVLREAEAAGIVEWSGSHWTPASVDAVGTYYKGVSDEREVDASRRYAAYCQTAFEGPGFTMLGVVRDPEKHKIERIIQQARLEVLEVLATEDPTGTPVCVTLKIALVDALR